MTGVVTTGIVLSRTSFGEADRILTILTPDQGKISVIAKGVRKSKSKLAAGIELFSISQITFLPPKKEVGTLISSRLQKHFGHIVEDVERTNEAYNLLKQLNRLTESAAGEEYFKHARSALAALNHHDLSLEMFNIWNSLQTLKITGHSPNLAKDTAGDELSPDKLYTFDFDTMSFAAHKAGMFGPEHIKLLRLVSNMHDPTKLTLVRGIEKFLPACQQLVSAMMQQNLHI